MRTTSTIPLSLKLAIKRAQLMIKKYNPEQHSLTNMLLEQRKQEREPKN